jgi:S-adenosylmethionine hydrolase
MSIITLTTDFGTSASDVAVLSGVIWRIAPDARIVDLSHAIPPQDILSAQVVLANTTAYFPDGTIHVVVVDPGVGTDRRPIAARLGQQFFVGPDNGLLTPLLEKAEAERWDSEIYHLNRPNYWLPRLSSVFHGRDIFAPVAAHLASGVPISALGEMINDAVRIDIPVPNLVDGAWRGQVIHIDYYGNLITNIHKGHLEGMPSLQTVAGGQVITGLSRTYGDGQAGDLVALINSSNQLCICLVNGSAAASLKAHPGDPVEVRSRPTQAE